MEVAKEETELLDDESIESSDDVRLHPAVMKEQDFTPVIWVQKCSVWWLCRSLALTSSSVDKLIIAAASHIFASNPLREDFECVLAYASCEK